MLLGRGRFAHVQVSEKDEGMAVKTIDVDGQRPPHSWRAEIAALQRLQTAQHVVHITGWTANLASMEPQVRIEMPRYAMTLEHVIYHYAKAKYPPGSGWRNVMPAQRIQTILRGIASGLNSVHRSGIIHRDLKPENVLFTGPESDPVLIDFGIAWVPDTSESSEPAGDRITDVGSAEYKAPELLFGIRHYTEKIDLWALGCILCRLLGPDCVSLFSPYSSDMALIAAQIRELGAPNTSACPSLVGSVAEHIQSSVGSVSSVNQTSSGGSCAGLQAALPITRTFRHLENSEVLAQLATRLLSYEWTVRPCAEEVVQELSV